MVSTGHRWWWRDQRAGRSRRGTGVVVEESLPEVNHRDAGTMVDDCASGQAGAESMGGLVSGEEATGTAGPSNSGSWSSMEEQGIVLPRVRVGPVVGRIRPYGNNCKCCCPVRGDLQYCFRPG